jgi:hypothetical protein
VDRGPPAVPGPGEEPTGSRQFGLLLDLADAEARAGDLAADNRIAEALDITTDRDDVARALAVRARTCYARGDHAGTAAANEAALDLLDPAEPVAQSLLAGHLAAGLFHAPSRARTASRMVALTGAARAGQMPDNPALLAHLALRFAVDGEPRDRGAGDRRTRHRRRSADRRRSSRDAADPCRPGVVRGRPPGRSRGRGKSGRRRGSSAWFGVRLRPGELPAGHSPLPPRCTNEALADVKQCQAAGEEGWPSGGAWRAELFTLLHLERGEPTIARQRI